MIDSCKWKTWCNLKVQLLSFVVACPEKQISDLFNYFANSQTIKMNSFSCIPPTKNFER